MHHVRGIRSSLFGTDKNGAPITRLVFDLDQPVEFQGAVHAGKFVITIHDRVSLSEQKTQVPAAPPVKQSPPALPAPPEPKSVATAPPTELNRIRISSTADSLSIRLDFDNPAVPQTTRQDHRLVLDFANTSFSPLWSQPATLRVNSSAIKTLRVGALKNPPVLRIVLDQNNETPPEISSEGGSLVLQFRGGNAVSASASPSTPQPTPSPASSPPTSLGISPKPPMVMYKSGLLFVDADNSTLADILSEIAKETGAIIDVPRTDGLQDYVVLKVGPARPVYVIYTLLQGSSYQCQFEFKKDGSIAKIIVTPK
jgi:hypothetical protein